MKDFVKVVNPGRVEIGGRMREVFVEIVYEHGELRLHGAEGPRRSGNCAGGFGQIVDRLQNIKICHKGWRKKGNLTVLREYWRIWHLNYMNPGCEHQVLWDTEKELVMPDGRTVKAGWARFDEHEEGLLGKPCPVCGYKYGTEWKKREVPDHVLEWLRDLPEAKSEQMWAYRPWRSAK
jgi:hypothetical protein